MRFSVQAFCSSAAVRTHSASADVCIQRYIFLLGSMCVYLYVCVCVYLYVCVCVGGMVRFARYVGRGGYPKWYKWARTSRRVNNIRARDIIPLFSFPRTQFPTDYRRFFVPFHRSASFYVAASYTDPSPPFSEPLTRHTRVSGNGGLPGGLLWLRTARRHFRPRRF